MSEHHIEAQQSGSSSPQINWWIDGPLLVLSAIGTVIGGIFGFLLDVVGFWLIVGLHVVVAAGAVAVNATLGAVVIGIMVVGWTLYFVATIVLAIGGEALQNRILRSSRRS